MCNSVPTWPTPPAVLAPYLDLERIIDKYDLRPGAVTFINGEQAPWVEFGRQALEATPTSRCAYCHTTTTAAIRCASCGAPR